MSHIDDYSNLDDLHNHIDDLPPDPTLHDLFLRPPDPTTHGTSPQETGRVRPDLDEGAWPSVHSDPLMYPLEDPHSELHFGYDHNPAHLRPEAEFGGPDGGDPYQSRGEGYNLWLGLPTDSPHRDPMEPGGLAFDEAGGSASHPTTPAHPFDTLYPGLFPSHDTPHPDPIPRRDESASLHPPRAAASHHSPQPSPADQSHASDHEASRAGRHGDEHQPVVRALHSKLMAPYVVSHPQNPQHPDPALVPHPPDDKHPWQEGIGPLRTVEPPHHDIELPSSRLLGRMVMRSSPRGIIPRYSDGTWRVSSRSRDDE